MRVCDDKLGNSLASDQTGASRDPHKAEPPDGGYGWVVVAASFCIATIIATTGMYGVFFIELLEYFQQSNSVTAWPASLYIGLGLGAGPLACILCNRFGHRITCIIGSVLSAVGYVICAYATSIYHWYLGFGILSGIGYNFQYVTLTVMVACYFSKRRATATGLAVTGIGVGMLINAPVLDGLIKAYTWRGAALIFGAIALQASVFATLLSPLPGVTDHQEIDVTFLPDVSLLKDWKLVLFAFVECLWNIGASVYMSLLPDFAYSVGMSKSRSTMLMSYLGIGSLVGRLLLVLLFKLRPLARICVYALATLISGLCIFGNVVGVSYWVFVLCSLLYGVCFGLQSGLMPIIAADLFGLERLTAAYSYILLGDGVGCTGGPPLAGWMFDLTASYTVSWIVCGVLTCLASLLMVPVGLKSFTTTAATVTMNRRKELSIMPDEMMLDVKPQKELEVLVDKETVITSIRHG